MSALLTCPVGTRIWFKEGGKRPFRVRARSDRFLVCTKPFNIRRTVLYTVIDLQKDVRGTENLVFGFGAETGAQCREMVARLDAGESAVSSRNQVPLSVCRTKLPES